jgi:hypothetical protein
MLAVYPREQYRVMINPIESCVVFHSVNSYVIILDR